MVADIPSFSDSTSRTLWPYPELLQVLLVAAVTTEWSNSVLSNAILALWSRVYLSGLFTIPIIFAIRVNGPHNMGDPHNAGLGKSPTLWGPLTRTYSD